MGRKVVQERNIRIYVAGCGHHHEKISKVIEIFRNGGCDITHDWTKTIVSERNLCSKQKGYISNLDIQAVKDADALVIIQYETDEKSLGARAELGAALALNKPVYAIILEGLRDGDIFIHHPLVTHFDNVEDCLKELRMDWSISQKLGWGFNA